MFKVAVRIAPFVVVALGAAPALACPGWNEAEAPVEQAAAQPDALVEVSLAESGWDQSLAGDAAGADGLLVDLEDGLSDDQIRRLADEVGVALSDTTDMAEGNLWVVRGTAEQLAAAMKKLEGRSEIEGVEPNVSYAAYDDGAPPFVDATDAPKPAPTKPNDPMYKHQWHFEMVHAEEAWARTDGKGVIVAVIDTGVSEGKIDGAATKFKRVPDLKETEFVPGWNFVANKRDASDGNGHGTHVAGTIAQSTNNGFGVAGLAPKAKIMAIKVLSDQGSGTVGDIANGIRFAADKGAKVINMSLGGGLYSPALAKAVKYAHDKGVLVACAAGNGGRQKVEYPAAYPGCVAVSALGPDGKLAFYSSYGKETDIAAPGGDTRVDLNKDGIPDGVLQDTIARGDPTKHGFFPFQGTSMATPHVAAAAALVISTGVNDPDRVEAVLKGSASKLNDPIRYGAGGLDAAAAVKKSQHDSAGWSLGIAGLLGALAVARSKRRDGLLRVRGALPIVSGIVVAASGLFFLADLGLGSSAVVTTLSSPLADWPTAILGSAPQMNALEGSFLLALVPMAFLLGVKGLRPLLAGLAFGVAGYLMARGLLGSVDVAWLPGHGLLDHGWLVVNGAIAAVLGRLALRD